MLDKNSFIALMIISWIILLGLFFLGSQFAPSFTFYLGVILITIIAYILSENYIFHDAAEFENRFWTSMSFFFAYTMILVSDSPFRLPLSIGWIIIIGFTFLAHNYNRLLHRKLLEKPTEIPWTQNEQETVTSKSVLPNIFLPISDCLNIIDHPWISSNIFLPGVLYAEKRIISMFDECTAEELNNALPILPLPLIMYKIKDHRMARLYNRSKLLKILCETRVRQLKIQSKAILLDALMRMKLSANAKCDEYVCNIISCTFRNDLTELKCLMDSKLDINSMHKLFYDIRDKGIQQRILSHLKKQANEQRAHSQIGSREGRGSKYLAWKKILSDVDDTLLCSGGGYPAGVDKTYPRKAIYPGVLSFYRELEAGPHVDKGLTDTAKRQNNLNLNLVFLSARPHVYKDLSESRTFLKFREMEGLNARPTLLSGSIAAGTSFIMNDNIEALSQVKYQSYKEYISLYPEYKSIFIGDNGQGDVLAAEMIFNDKDLTFISNHTNTMDSTLSRAYMHIVKPISQTSVRDISYKNPWKVQSKIFYFYTYIDAAIDAYKHDLISIFGLRRIMSESIHDFYKIPENKFHHEAIQNHLKREKQMRELNRSISIGNQILQSKHVEAVRLMPFKQYYSIGLPVSFGLFGYGIIVGFRSYDGVYTIDYSWDRTGKSKLLRAYVSFGSIKAVPIDSRTLVSLVKKIEIPAASSNILSMIRYPSMTAKPKKNETSTEMNTSIAKMTSLLSPFRSASATAATVPPTAATSGQDLAKTISSSSVQDSQDVKIDSELTSLNSSQESVVSIGKTRQETSRPHTPERVPTDLTDEMKKVAGDIPDDDFVYVDKQDALLSSSTSQLIEQNQAIQSKSTIETMTIPYRIELQRITGKKETNINSNVSSVQTSSESNPSRSMTTTSSSVSSASSPLDTTKISKSIASSSILAPRNLISSLSTATTTATESSKFIEYFGSVVWTPFGRAYLMDHRSKDDIFTVRYLDWNGFAFLRRESIAVISDPLMTFYKQDQLRLEEEYNQRMSALKSS